MLFKNKVQLALGVVFLYLLQLHIWAMEGMNSYVKFVSPIFILVVSLLILYNYNRTHEFDIRDNKPQKHAWLGAVIGLVSIAICYEELRILFSMYSNPTEFSDVIPQLEALYDRFAAGEYPYKPVHFPSHSPFPVYLPVNWLPVGLARYFEIDSRWIGMVFLAGGIGLYGGYVFRSYISIWFKIILTILPSLIIWSCVLLKTNGMPVTLETIIAAYYLVLAIGLVTKNLPLTVLGIILCLLSRYTMVFWLPMFAYLLWVNMPKKYSFIVWGVVGVAIVVTLAPFFGAQPESFFAGVEYHNHCAIAEMQGYGGGHVSWSHESGVYFAPYFKLLLSGDAAYKVTFMRIVQAMIMILLNVIAIYKYRKLKGKVDFYKYSLGYLYLFMLCFYMFSPLTYWYYYIPLFCLSAVLVADTCINVLCNRKTIEA